MADDRLSIARGAIQEALTAVDTAQTQLLSPPPVSQLTDPTAFARGLRDVRDRLANLESRLTSLGAPAVAPHGATPPKGDRLMDGRDALADAQIAVLTAKNALLDDLPRIAGVEELRPDLEELTNRFSALLEPVLDR